MEQGSRWGLSGGTLKIIALVTMIIDHLTYEFVDYSANRSLWMLGRGIGRLAFPIYCFLIVEGFIHTRNVKKYCFRLFLFALLSEVPFDLAFFGTVLYTGHQNVFFTLLFGLLLLCVVKWANEPVPPDKLEILFTKRMIAVLSIVAAYFISLEIESDYGFWGILLILFFNLYHDSKKGIATSNVLVNLVMSMGSNVQLYGICATVPILLYNGKKGVSLKYFFYLIYPLHLLLLYWIKYYLL